MSSAISPPSHASMSSTSPGSTSRQAGRSQLTRREQASGEDDLLGGLARGEWNDMATLCALPPPQLATGCVATFARSPHGDGSEAGEPNASHSAFLIGREYVPRTSRRNYSDRRTSAPP